MNVPNGNKRQYIVEDFQGLKNKMLNWTNRFSIFCFLDNHLYQVNPNSAECLLGAGCQEYFTSDKGKSLSLFQQFINQQVGWLFGHLNYDLKNEIEDLTSEHPDRVDFPEIFFFKPQVVLRLNEQHLEIEADDPEQVYNEILSCNVTDQNHQSSIGFSSRVTKEAYLNTIRQLKAHILKGDCYEINYCVEYFAENAIIKPLSIYKKLSDLSPNPFSAFYKCNDKYLLCASPERFIKRTGDQLLSQPIKGTTARILTDKSLDEASMQQLINSEKDKAENVMVVDLVRNDLSKVCEEGSVKVTELFGIYSFPQVHQMISTVEGKLEKEILFTDIVKAMFPMGSMTGAPKKRVMELIEQYEKSRRGIFSGAVGYISPSGDFDFNVVIRSIMYNAEKKYLSYQVGSAITYLSDPEQEWEECLLKAEAIKKVLS